MCLEIIKDLLALCSKQDVEVSLHAPVTHILDHEAQAVWTCDVAPSGKYRLLKYDRDD